MKTQRVLHIAAVFAALASVNAAAGTAPATRPAPATELRALLQARPGRLTMAPDSASSRFHLTFVLSTSDPLGAVRSFAALVARDGPRVVIAVRAGTRSDAGPVLCYITNDLYVGLDPRTPGGLLVDRGMQPRFALTAKKDRPGVWMQLTCAMEGPAAVTYDPVALVLSLLGDARDVQSNDAAADHFTILRTRGRIRLRTVPRFAPWPPMAVKEMVIEFDDPNNPGIGAIVGDSPEPTIDCFGLTVDALAKLNVPIRERPAGELLVVPPPIELTDDRRHREIGLALARLMPPRNAFEITKLRWPY